MREERPMTKAIPKMICGILFVFILLFLCSCSARYQENKKIYQYAQKYAQSRAAEAIWEKYNIEADTHGYEVQGEQMGFAFYADSEVVVCMSYEGKRFCALIDLYDKDVLWDNYQQEQYQQILLEYLLELYHLPQPSGSDVTFSIAGGKSGKAPFGTDYDAHNLVNFRFDGQTVEDFLSRLDSLEYEVAYLDLEQSLNGITLSEENWPKTENFSVALRIRQYISGFDFSIDEKFDFAMVTPHFSGVQYLKQWLSAYGCYSQSEAFQRQWEFYDFYHIKRGELTWISTTDMDMDKSISFSQCDSHWIQEYSNASFVYRPISDCFMVEEEHLNIWLYVCTDLANAYDNDIFIASRDKNTGKVQILNHILSEKELALLSQEDAFDMYEKYSNNIFSIRPGLEYAVVERIEQIPK